MSYQLSQYHYEAVVMCTTAFTPNNKRNLIYHLNDPTDQYVQQKYQKLIVIVHSAWAYTNYAMVT